MLQDVLPSLINQALLKLNFNNLQELRLRANKPTTICYNNKYYFLSSHGASIDQHDGIVLTNSDLDDIVFRASNFSLYAVNDDIKNGFITLQNGIRIGLVGQVVSENGMVITINHFSALNIRFPHEIKGISNQIIDYLVDDDDFLNTLIISPPGAGKTTLLRDITRQISGIKLSKNVLVVDERNEISGCNKGRASLDIGMFSDVLVGGDKSYAFVNGIRSMSPQVIVTDEIGTKKDIECLTNASTCGVNILATIHAKNINDLLQKPDFVKMISDKIFKRYVVLSCLHKKGTIEGIYNENLQEISFDKVLE